MGEKSTSDHIETIEHGAVAPNVVKITQDSWFKNKKVILICLAINMATLEYGLDQGMVNGFQAMPGFLRYFGYEDPTLPGGYGISTTVQQLISSLVSAGMFASTFAAGWLCKIAGRKGGIWTGLLLMLISVTIQILANNVGMLYAGRLILGLSNGFLLVCAQLYLQETMPSNLRSLSFTLWQFWISLGALIGTVINNATQRRLDKTSYQIPLALLYIVPVFLGIGLFKIPETPRHLVASGKKDEAYKALRYLRDQSYSDLQVKEELAEIMHSIEMDMEVSNGVGYFEMFQKRSLKRTLTSLGLGLYSAANGVPFITQYSVYFFLLSGETSPFRAGIILLCVGLIGVLVTPLITGKIGKRRILGMGGLLQALCMLGIAVSYTARGADVTSGKVIVAMCSIYLFVASGTTSPFSWQVSGEIPSQRLRSFTLGFASSVTYLCGWVITFTIPYFINPTELAWGPKYAYIWFATNLMICVFTYLVVPETNGRTLEEIDECFNEGVPVRKFAQHQCSRTLNSRIEVVQDAKA